MSGGTVLRGGTVLAAAAFRRGGTSAAAGTSPEAAGPPGTGRSARRAVGGGRPGRCRRAARCQTPVPLWPPLLSALMPAVMVSMVDTLGAFEPMSNPNRTTTSLPESAGDGKTSDST